MPFKKYRLLKYEPEPYEALNSHGWGYILTVEVWTWWGLKKRIVKKSQQVSYSFDAEAFWEPKLNVWMPQKK
jgi:hypothetical protein